MSLKEQYEELKERIGYYMLLQAYAFVHTCGRNNIDAAIRCLAEKASDINLQEVKRLPESEYAAALGSALAKHMGEVFNSRYRTEVSEDSFRVILEECGCLGCTMKYSAEFEFDDVERRSYFCKACIEGYHLSAEKLGVKFEAYLTPLGCSMKFITLRTDNKYGQNPKIRTF